MNIPELLTSDIVCYIAITAMAFFIVLVSTPTIIFTAIRHKLFDTSDLHRKSHKRNVSNLGGIAIFCSFTLSVLLFSALFNYQQSAYVIISCIILFATGLKDDIYGTGFGTKFLLNIIVAMIIVFLGQFKLTSFYGVLNVEEINVVASTLFSILLIIFLNNAFNLIDGIDGLAGTIGVIVNISFGLLFAYCDQMSYAFIAFALAGALGGFLYYNYAPAKIFMGDTGALITGLVSVTLAIQFIEQNKDDGFVDPAFDAAPAIAVAILIIPIFDSLRIFFIRILNKRSPFLGDRNHIHHRLQSVGLSDTRIVALLAAINILFIGLTLVLQHVGNFILITSMIVICMILNFALTYIKGRRRSSSYSITDIFTKDFYRIDLKEQE